MEFNCYYTSLNKQQKLELAEKLNSSVMYLCHIAKGRRKAGVKIITGILKATDGVVTPEVMRPDIYGES